MRHNYKGRKLGTDYSHTKAMKRSLCKNLFLNDRIKTTEARAKEIRGDVDKIITWAKRGDLHSRRLAIAALGNDSELVREIFEKVAQGMFKDRSGGYTRIIKLGNRKGDNAKMVIIELIGEALPTAKTVAKKATPKKKATSASSKKTEAKADDKKATEKSDEVAVEKSTDAKAEETSEQKSEAKEASIEKKSEDKSDEAENKADGNQEDK